MLARPSDPLVPAIDRVDGRGQTSGSGHPSRTPTRSPGKSRRKIAKTRASARRAAAGLDPAQRRRMTRTPSPGNTLGVVALVGVAGLATLAVGCSPSASAASPELTPAPVHAETAVVAARSVPRTLSLTGSLVAAREAEVAAEGAGRVVAVLVERGDVVQAGQVLARLDSRSAALASAEASASAAALAAEEANARLDCRRADRLLAGNAISRAEFDRIETTCATSARSVDAARAREGLANKALSDARVRAPFGGVVAERHVEVGDYVTSGESVLSLVNTNTLKLELVVPETAVANVAPGRAVTFTVAAFPDREFGGTITREAPTLREKSRDQLVEVAVENADGALRPGMFASARIAVAEQREPVVPLGAVSGRAPSERVFVVGADHRVEERVVASGDRLGDGVVVTKGLVAGERVVTRITPGIRDGATVE